MDEKGDRTLVVMRRAIAFAGMCRAIAVCEMKGAIAIDGMRGAITGGCIKRGDRGCVE